MEKPIKIINSSKAITILYLMIIAFAIILVFFLIGIGKGIFFVFIFIFLFMIWISLHNFYYKLYVFDKFLIGFRMIGKKKIINYSDIYQVYKTRGRYLGIKLGSQLIPWAFYGRTNPDEKIEDFIKFLSTKIPPECIQFDIDKL